MFGAVESGGLAVFSLCDRSQPPLFLCFTSSCYMVSKALPEREVGVWRAVQNIFKGKFQFCKTSLKRLSRDEILK